MADAERVGPEGGDEGAELGKGGDNDYPSLPSHRAVAHDTQQPAGPQPPAQPTEAELSKNLLQRLRAMFLQGPGAPRRSFMDPVTDQSHLWLLVAVKKAVKSFWEAHAEEAKSCCEPSLLAEMEMRGYLANDALGNPLLPVGYGPHCPDAVGKRVLNGVTKAEKDVKAAQKTARAAVRKGVAIDGRRRSRYGGAGGVGVDI
jgi:hypothetical protein